jgi:hypothetical protein
MFKKSLDDRLSSWAKFRSDLSTSDDPLSEVCKFWSNAPFIPYNKNIDPYNPKSWPTPWDIIAYNKYDDFTKALMIGWTIKYSDLYRNSTVEVKTFLDKSKPAQYNVIFIDSKWVLNFVDNEPVIADNFPDNLFLENLIELE